MSNAYERRQAEKKFKNRIRYLKLKDMKLASTQKYWRFVEQEFDRSETSASENILRGLGLPDDNAWMPLSWHINRALEKKDET